MSRPLLCLCAVPVLVIGCKGPESGTSTPPPQGAAPGGPPPSAGDKDHQPDEEVGVGPTPAPGFPDDIQRVNDCTTSAESLFGEAQTALIRCPANCDSGEFAGTSVYPTTAPACTSQMHAGILSKEGGLVLLTRTEGLSRYRGSQQFGIKSSDLGYFRFAFYGQGVDEEGFTTTPVPTPMLE
jgi:hypothetical protein